MVIYFLDLTQDIDESLRFRSNLFNKDHFITFCAINELQKKNEIEYEEIEGEQTYVIHSKRC